VRWIIPLAFAVSACASAAGEQPTTVSTTSSTAITVAAPSPPMETEQAVFPEGFATVGALVTTADGTTCEICVWLADTPRQRSSGLMFVTDLGVADAMAFRYPDVHTGTFWMKNTVMPLSIAFYAPDGGFLDSFDMSPCTSDPCPNYPTPTDFLIAIEVPQGDLDAIGLTAGSTFEFLDLPCR
jgi:uncharacterized membrane protein (UPF0127 family)